MFVLCDSDRQTGESCQVKRFPQEAEHLEIPRCFLVQTLTCLTQFAQDCPSELVFNLDEVGISELEDRKTESGMIPNSMSEQMIHHTANRNLKDVSVVACVSAAGESLISYIATSQDSAYVREQ
jgi:hypothetical protein